MAAVTFDTLKFANRLKQAGVPDKQAEAECYVPLRLGVTGMLDPEVREVNS